MDNKALAEANAIDAQAKMPLQPGKALDFKPIHLQNLFVMYYRKGQNPFPMSKIFVCNGDLMKAIEKSKDHCERITARFLRTEPLIRDLDKEESIYLNAED